MHHKNAKNRWNGKYSIIFAGSVFFVFGTVQGWGCYTNFLRSVIFLNFQIHQNTSYLYDIMYIFDKCHRIWGAETSGKYDHD